MAATVASAVHDPDGHLVDKTDQLVATLLRITGGGLAVQLTDETDPRLRAVLEAQGAALASAPASRERIGWARRQGVALALDAAPADQVLMGDLDHLLRWAQRDPAGLDDALRVAATHDFTVMGRTSTGFSSMPRRLRETEVVVNHVWLLATGWKWDVMMGVRGISPAAARAIVEECEEATIGNDTAWPLFCRSRGFDVGYVEADGLRYLTEQRWAQGVDEHDDTDDPDDHLPAAWLQRLDIAMTEVEAMQPYFL